jgi:hypothetical protein
VFISAHSGVPSRTPPEGIRGPRLRRVPGVTTATVQLAEGKLVVEGSPSREELIKAIERAGYGVA